MQKSEVIEQVKNKQPNPVMYSAEDIVKITNLFSILIKIDQKVKSQGGSNNVKK